MRRHLIASTATALTLFLGIGACSSGDPVVGPTTTLTGKGRTPRIDLDPRRYFEDYAVAADEDASTGVAGPNASPTNVGASSSSSSRSEVTPDVVEPPVVPGIDEDNTFDPSGHHRFVPTATDARSTFGLDVDTGSFAIGRTFLTEGQRPPADSVRTEEWVNAFGYGYPAPKQGDLGVTVDGAPAPFAEDGTQLLRIGLQGRSIADPDRPDANLTFVVDVSGSMDIRERLGLVKASLALLVLNLRDTDTLSIVTYSDEAAVLLPPTAVRDAKRIVAAIDELQPSNSTNMEAGLRQGYAQAKASFRPNAINTVILASDGVANVGDTGKGSLSDLIHQEGLEGVRLVTVGFGMGNYNDALMEALADRGDGFYSYVDTFAEAERLFTRELTPTLTVIADDAKAQVTFDPLMVESYRLLGYENRDLADEQFDDDTVDAGELGAGHTVTALYELHLTAAAEDADAGAVGSVALRYGSTAAGKVVATTTPISLAAFAPTFAAAPANLLLAGTVAAFAGYLGDDPQAAERGVTLAGLATLARGLEAPPATDGRATAADLAALIDQARRADD